ncbi:MAG: hypothetical protein IJU16_06855 [Clostridia bacterium]|nr:hypothetical protein [Clostridia bacterium]
MRHVFIVNPAAGKNRAACERVPQIEAVFAANRDLGTPQILYTEAPGHATAIAAEEAEKGDAVRLYACGGDGTLSEVLQGIYGRENAELACLPSGSANDYVRSFPEYDFRNIAALVTGSAQPVDVIRCGDLLSLDICCMGMDADVAYKMGRYKTKPLVSGPMSYNLAIVDVFCHRIGKNLTVTMQTPRGEVIRQGRYFIALAASGQYYGGGYRGAAMAQPDDGLLDFVLIKAMSRAKIPGFLGQYKKGVYNDPAYYEHFTGTEMTVVCDEDVVAAIDGECITGSSLTFSLCDKRVRFVLPQRGDIKEAIFRTSPPRRRVGNMPAGSFVKKL